MREPEYLTIRGEKFALLPLKSYNELIEKMEDMHDIAYATAIKEQIEKGQMECFPSSVIDALTSGNKNHIKVYREYRGMTQNELAKEAGISTEMVRKMENGNSSGSIKSLMAISKVLNIDLDSLVRWN